MANMQRGASQKIKGKLLQVANVQSNKWKDLEEKIRNKMKAFAGDDSFVESHVRSHLERYLPDFFSIYDTTEKKKQQDEVVKRVAKGVKKALSEIADTPLKAQFAQQDVYNFSTEPHLVDGIRAQLSEMFWECYDQVINELDEDKLKRYSRDDVTQEVIQKMQNVKYKQLFAAVAASYQKAVEKYNPNDLNEKRRISVDVNFIPQSTKWNPGSVLAPQPHMDNMIGDEHRNLSRYARKLGQDSPKDFLLTSFCSGLKNRNFVILDCPTKIYSGVPVVDIDVMRDVVETHVIPEAGGLTPLQAEEIVTQLLQEATDTVLASEGGGYHYDPDRKTGGDNHLRDAGISVYDAPKDAWTNANSVSYHRSPSQAEVAQSGNVSRLLRVFIGGVITKEEDKDDIVYNEDGLNTGVTQQVVVRIPHHLNPEDTNRENLDRVQKRIKEGSSTASTTSALGTGTTASSSRQ